MKRLECSAQIAKGMEHNVYLDVSGKTVIKTPTPFSRTWHLMKAGLAERDQVFLQEYGIPHISTTIEEGPFLISLQNGTRSRAEYVMRQPYLNDARPLTFDMLQQPEMMKRIAAMIEGAERLFQELRLGVDFIGGKAFGDLARAFVQWRVQAALYNVLVPNVDHHDDEGALVAKAGAPILCDTRLYDCTSSIFYPDVHLRTNIHYLQYAVLYEFLDRLGSLVPQEKSWKNLIHRFVAKLLYLFVGRRITAQELPSPSSNPNQAQLPNQADQPVRMNDQKGSSDDQFQ